jgi:hypothetical protein
MLDIQPLEPITHKLSQTSESSCQDLTTKEIFDIVGGGNLSVDLNQYSPNIENYGGVQTSSNKSINRKWVDGKSVGKNYKSKSWLNPTDSGYSEYTVESNF